MSLDPHATVGLAGAFVLGLRHGLDPDHIAAVDAMTYRALDERPALARWAGTLFALGHGGVVLVIAVLVGALGARYAVPAPWSGLLEWAPVVLLSLLGLLNLRALLRPSGYQPATLRLWLVPRALRGSTHPLAMLGVGAVLGLVFDTATQAAAWGYAASAQQGVWGALGVGLAFTLGMVLTDSLDGRLMCRFLSAASPEGAQLYRRAVGWFTVAVSFTVVGYTALSACWPHWTLPDAWLTALGAALVTLMAAGVLWLNLRRPTALAPSDQPA
ncbi:MAG: nickel permease [Candidatus Sericytochromatia bacterium]|nr:nickel permease [Candidatus Sericytochromatia bacterium]